MADILLLEPGYHNKYPPLGLMKISYFHKYICGDYVRFAKGKLPDAFKDKKWDRVYVTTLFTFEWENTKKAIEYALSVVKDQKNVYTGGILATLMPELISETFPTVKNNTGLLNRKGTLGIKGEECIDTLTPDYGILDDIKDEYIYPAHDAYFAYMTRGCGMKCQFCAVQTLEPTYIPYLSITDSIRRIDEQFGPKKDLLLMDNNVLRSPDFNKIIDEIKELGFAKGATYINPVTGKCVQRYVDFNQGLDAFLLTPDKAKRLGELAIRPARIAFDHIEDKDAYVKAIRRCAENGISHMSNYLLYNGEEFKGKGHSYHADTPEDLYNRMRITLDLCDELNDELKPAEKISIFSFPMRYIPLSDLKRGFVGTNWKAKYLRAVQRMLIPTQGKGVSSRSFFEADFGKSAEEFVEALAMPESHLGWRGHFVEKKNATKEENELRLKIWEENQQYINEWKKLYRSLSEKQKNDFVDIINDNVFSVERFNTIKNKTFRKLFIHYFTIPSLVKAFSTDNTNSIKDISDYITVEFPLMYKRMVEYISQISGQYSIIEGPYRVFSCKLIKDILSIIDVLDDSSINIVNYFSKIQSKTSIYTFDYLLIRYSNLFEKAGAFTKQNRKDVISGIKELNEDKVRKILIDRLPIFEKLIANIVSDQIGASYLMEELNTGLLKVNQQLTLFGD